MNRPPSRTRSSGNGRFTKEGSGRKLVVGHESCLISIAMLSKERNQTPEFIRRGIFITKIREFVRPTSGNSKRLPQVPLFHQE